MNLCKNNCPNSSDILPAQLKRSFYQNTARETAATPVKAAEADSPSYEQSFPGYEEDFLYFTRNYPVAVRPYVIPVRDAFDKLEYRGSILFDRYPDREQLLRIADDIIRITGASRDTGDNPTDDGSGRDILIMLMLHELMRRRERYRHGQNP